MQALLFTFPTFLQAVLALPVLPLVLRNSSNVPSSFLFSVAPRHLEYSDFHQGIEIGIAKTSLWGSCWEKLEHCCMFQLSLLREKPPAGDFFLVLCADLGGGDYCGGGMMAESLCQSKLSPLFSAATNLTFQIQAREKLAPWVPPHKVCMLHEYFSLLFSFPGRSQEVGIFS